MNEIHPTKDKIVIKKERAKTMVRKSILIGLTYINHKGSITDQKQLHGNITQIGNRGISVELHGVHRGEKFRLPPDIKALKEAKPGEYRLRTTGEVIINPDLLVTYEINQPASK